uniref:Uncharacterized protein n=1 Tax=Colobus angolensis palliatus TaxID=336983 RepID=A0A2K5IDI1_COLAP
MTTALANTLLTALGEILSQRHPAKLTHGHAEAKQKPFSYILLAVLTANKDKEMQGISSAFCGTFQFSGCQEAIVTTALAV